MSDTWKMILRIISYIVTALLGGAGATALF